MLSAPSGAGKTTLRESLRQTSDFVYSVSYTTRVPRPGERDGTDYHFVSEEQFAQMVARQQFLEHALVHGQNAYGTALEPIRTLLQEGTDVLVDVDVQGAERIRACPDELIQNALADVFIMPPSLGELKRRLERRGTESVEQIEQRIASARQEMQSWRSYRYTLWSGSMEEDLHKFRAIMRAERYLTRRILSESDSEVLFDTQDYEQV